MQAMKTPNDMMVAYRFPRALDELLDAAARVRGETKSSIVRTWAEFGARKILEEDSPFEFSSREGE